MRGILFAVFLLLAAVAAACGGDDDGGDATLTPAPSRPEFGPPLEGGRQDLGPSERTNFREHPDYQMPDPAVLPPPPDGAQGPEFSPPETADCPVDWLAYPREAEGFAFCYPPDWEINGDGYVTLPFQDRWFSAGAYRFVGGTAVAHVSFYAYNNYSLPYDYTRACGQPYSVTFAGQPAVLCPDYPGVFPEERIISYHVRTEQFDYLVNAVPYYAYDPETGSYGATADAELEQTAIEIAQTFQLTEPVPR